MDCHTDHFRLVEHLRNVRLLVLDVDGVMTNGSLYYSDSGEEIKAFCVQDGQGIKLLQDSGIAIGIISGRTSALLARRAQNLGIVMLYQGREDKLTALNELCAAHGYRHAEIAYVGDDLPDIQVLKSVGVAFTVANAHDEVKRVAHACTRRTGGDGAVREVADFILQSLDRYDAAIARFL
jgi:3-deoxy-D-manno-octulosonate 8-phosphate phosphatase (KDO 8-P phosphatase)